MKLLLDTNILLDVICKNRPHSQVSSKLFDLCAKGLIPAYAPSFSFVTIVYLLCERLKLCTLHDLEDIYAEWKNIVQFVPTTSHQLEQAFTGDSKDYEDALQILAATEHNVDYIVTNNTKDFRRSPIPAITPTEFFQNIFISASRN